MSSPVQAKPVKLVASILSAEARHITAALKELAGFFGNPDFISEVLDFPFTDYYKAELGTSPVRRVAAFGKLIPPESLPEIKLLTNKLEQSSSAGGKRQVNIDPGYISPCHLILATGKGYAHRPYLRDGIYADLTLIFEKGSFRKLEWTYPDYAGPVLLSIMGKIRKKYMLQLKSQAE